MENKKLFINFSNHPSENWNKKQIEKCYEMGVEEIKDVPFPAVVAEASEEEIEILAKACADKIIEMTPSVVLCQGEFSLTYKVVDFLKEAGIKVVCACSDRVVQEKYKSDGSTEKVVNFEFVGFREY